MGFADPLGCGAVNTWNSWTLRLHARHSDESPPRFPEDSIRDGIPAASRVGRSRRAGPPDRAYEHVRKQPGWALHRSRHRWQNRVDGGFWDGRSRERLTRDAKPPLSNRNRFHRTYLSGNWPAVGRRSVE